MDRYLYTAVVFVLLITVFYVIASLSAQYENLSGANTQNPNPPPPKILQITVGKNVVFQTWNSTYHVEFVKSNATNATALVPFLLYGKGPTLIAMLQQIIGYNATMIAPAQYNASAQLFYFLTHHNQTFVSQKAGFIPVVVNMSKLTYNYTGVNITLPLLVNVTLYNVTYPPSDAIEYNFSYHGTPYVITAKAVVSRILTHTEYVSTSMTQIGGYTYIYIHYSYFVTVTGYFVLTTPNSTNIVPFSYSNVFYAAPPAMFTVTVAQHTFNTSFGIPLTTSVKLTLNTWWNVSYYPYNNTIIYTQMWSYTERLSNQQLTTYKYNSTFSLSVIVYNGTNPVTLVNGQAYHSREISLSENQTWSYKNVTNLKFNIVTYDELFNTKRYWNAGYLLITATPHITNNTVVQGNVTTQHITYNLTFDVKDNFAKQPPWVFRYYSPPADVYKRIIYTLYNFTLGNITAYYVKHNIDVFFNGNESLVAPETYAVLAQIWLLPKPYVVGVFYPLNATQSEIYNVTGNKWINASYYWTLVKWIPKMWINFTQYIVTNASKVQYFLFLYKLDKLHNVLYLLYNNTFYYPLMWYNITGSTTFNTTKIPNVVVLHNNYWYLLHQPSIVFASGNRTTVVEVVKIITPST